MKYVWRWPVVLGLASLVGLAGGLMQDGWGDALAWIGLGIPVTTGGIGWRGRYTRHLSDTAAHDMD